MRFHHIVSICIIIMMNIFVLKVHVETENTSNALGGFYLMSIYWIIGFVLNLSVFIYYGIKKARWVDWILIVLSTPISSLLLIYMVDIM